MIRGDIGDRFKCYFNVSWTQGKLLLIGYRFDKLIID